MTNKVIAMTITEIEKSSNEFKKTHKIKVSGPYDDEQIPNWLKDFIINVNNFIESQTKFNKDIIQRIDTLVQKNNLKE
ncbi:MAG: hypothetical protein MJ200_04605 [Mycoplasmoidaceae bacterium]|nr:hypothetical protein [Mycoplasmoidaceae bacterium]